VCNTPTTMTEGIFAKVAEHGRVNLTATFMILTQFPEILHLACVASEHETNQMEARGRDARSRLWLNVALSLAGKTQECPRVLLVCQSGAKGGACNFWHIVFCLIDYQVVSLRSRHGLFRRLSIPSIRADFTLAPDSPRSRP
jgi:hypothetical protein